MAQWYSDGTIQVNSGGAVVGSGTLWASAATIGDSFLKIIGGLPTIVGEITAITDDTHITVTPAPATTAAGQSYYIKPDSPLRGSISQNNLLLTQFRTQLSGILTVSGADKTVTLNKTASTDNAGMLLQQGGTSLFQVGLFGNGVANNRFMVQYLVSSTWTAAISVDPTTGKVGFGVAAATQLLDAVASSAALALWDNAAAGTGKGGALYLQASNASSARTTFAALNAYVTTTTAGAEVGDLVFKTMRAGALTEAWKMLGAGALVPYTDDGAALGSAALKVSDIFLAAGAVVNFNNGDVTLTHSTDLLAIAGGDVSISNATASTSTSTGALRVANGGVGIGGALNVGGIIYGYAANEAVRLVEASAGAAVFDTIYTSGGTRRMYKGFGAGGSSPGYALVNEMASASVTITAHANGVILNTDQTSWASASDRRLAVKANALPVSVLDRLDHFRLVEYGENHREIGAIAQEFYRCFPHVVTRGDDDDRDVVFGDPGMWSIMYDRTGAIALGGVKELHALVRALTAKVAVLESRQHT
jgi:hypothetical protein